MPLHPSSIPNSFLSAGPITSCTYRPGGYYRSLQVWRAVDEEGQEREGYTYLVRCRSSETNVCHHKPVTRSEDPKKLQLLITRHFVAQQEEDLERVRHFREHFERDEPLYQRILAYVESRPLAVYPL